MKLSRTEVTPQSTRLAIVDALCGVCEYFVAGTPTSQGACHRHPPTASGFPQVETRDWCGEFEERAS